MASLFRYPFSSIRFFFKPYLLLGLFLLLGCFYPTSYAHASSEGKGGNLLLEHIQDAHDWHLATIGKVHVTVPLPIIVYKKGSGFNVFSSSRFYDNHHHMVAYKGFILNPSNKIEALDHSKVYDFSITKNVAAIFISAILLLLIFLLTGRYYRKKSSTGVPRGFYAFLEIIITFIRDEVAIPSIGKKSYARFMPYLLTVFFFIWLNNLLGLLPGAANVTGNISVTFTLALFTFLITALNANKVYWKHVFAPAVPKWLFPIMVPIEIVGLFTKPFSLMIRLFANITAGHIILLSIIFIIFILKTVAASIISVPFGIFMFFLKLLVSFLQAYVFTLLSAIYFGSAVEEAHDGH